AAGAGRGRLLHPAAGGAAAPARRPAVPGAHEPVGSPDARAPGALRHLVRFSEVGGPAAARARLAGPRGIGGLRLMEVILREDVVKLGRRGDVVKVAEGYGRNFLLPRGLAMAVTEANKAMIAKERKAHEAKMAKEKAEFEALAQRIGGVRF